jgi:hypothetical protein
MVPPQTAEFSACGWGKSRKFFTIFRILGSGAIGAGALNEADSGGRFLRAVSVSLAFVGIKACCAA